GGTFGTVGTRNQVHPTGLQVCPDQLAAGVVGEPGGQLGGALQARQPEGHVRRRTAWMLGHTAVCGLHHVHQRFADHQRALVHEAGSLSSVSAVPPASVSSAVTTESPFAAASRSRAASSHPWHRSASASPRSHKARESSSEAAPLSSLPTTSTSSSRACS